MQTRPTETLQQVEAASKLVAIRILSSLSFLFASYLLLVRPVILSYPRQ